VEKLTDIELENKDKLCKGCDISRDAYGKISRISNRLYNEALEVLKEGNVSLGIKKLNKSLEFDKTNANARALIGVCYYEIGEISKAIKEWIITLNTDSNNAQALRYLRSIEKNSHELDKCEKSIKYYNEALKFFEQGNDDIAVLKIKKAISSNPKLVQAKVLKAVIDLSDNHIEKALEELEEVLKVDKGNEKALYYYDMLKGNYVESKLEATMNRKRENDLFSKVMFKQNIKKNLLNPKVVFYMAIGAILSAIFIFGFINPVKQELTLSNIRKLERDTREYKVSIEQKDTEISQNKELVEDLNKEIELLKTKMTEMRKVEGAYLEYKNDNDNEAAYMLTKVDYSKLTSETKAMYNHIKNKTFDNAVKYYYNLAKEKNYEKENYELAIKNFTKVIEFGEKGNYAGYATYFTARSYQKLENYKKAIEYFEKYLEKYPSSSLRTNARNHLKAIK
jgi:tetratricopeptide (TPR) repeat protein